MEGSIQKIIQNLEKKKKLKLKHDKRRWGREDWLNINKGVGVHGLMWQKRASRQGLWQRKFLRQIINILIFIVNFYI